MSKVSDEIILKQEEVQFDDYETSEEFEQEKFTQNELSYNDEYKGVNNTLRI